MKVIIKHLFILLFCVSAIACHSKPPELGSNEPFTPNPELTNLPPIAIITVLPEDPQPYQLMTLDGSGSYDPDGGSIKAYSWDQLVDGEEVVLSDETTAKTSFIVPNVATTLSFQLVVADQYGTNSEPVSVSLKITPVSGPEPEPIAIYVSASMGSDDAENSGSHLEPAATINHGIALAIEKGLSNVFVMQGAYSEEVNLQSGIKLRGGVVAANSDGTPVFSTDAAKIAQISAPAGADRALNASNADDFLVQDFGIIGSMLIENSSNGEIVDNAFGNCIGLEITDSQSITINDNNFANSGSCTDYIGISIEGSVGVTIASVTKPNNFTISNGSETNIKAISVVDSNDIAVSGAVIENNGSPISAVFSGIFLSDTASSEVFDNTINVHGTNETRGVFIMCEEAVTNSRVEHNSIALTGAAGKEDGVNITCYQEGSTFNIVRNKIELSPSANTAVELYGIAANTNLRSVTLYIANNIIIMEAVSEGDDSADKSGVNLFKLGVQSKVDILHNTTLVAGKNGYLYAVSSDMNNVKFSAVNNIFFVFGSSGKNAAFRLKKSCGISLCASDVKNNLINSHFFNKNVNYIYYYDTKEIVGMNLAPVGNFKEKLKPEYFDLDNGILLGNYQSFAKDKGFVGLGITTDIEGNLRDALPDIGATEY